MKQTINEHFLEERFPELWRHISPEDVTDVDYNCGNLWVSTTDKITEKVEDASITENYMRNVAKTIGIYTGKSFNATDNLLCVDTDTLRVTCVHESVSNDSVSACLRKENARLRFTMEQAIAEGFCDEKTFHLLINCVLAGFNFTFCGIPGTGKTELLKHLSSYIPSHEKVITIEDVGEIHYSKINPNHNCIELKVGLTTYEKCITNALRMNPAWIIFGEALGKNTQQLLECWSNGVATMSTLHVNDARNIPDKIVNSLGIKQDSERIMNQVHNDVGIAILLKKRVTNGNVVKRYIDQICFYFRMEGVNGQALVLENGVLYPKRLPAFIQTKIEKELGRTIDSSPF
ncbi:MAG: Flp pilus assembly complex ATPase component TadA [Agathobacter sp.]|nr:Flp pilus assembly complex ATPase component TadA [Agathobacter sp.]